MVQEYIFNRVVLAHQRENSKLMQENIKLKKKIKQLRAKEHNLFNFISANDLTV